MKISERTIIDKVFQGISDNGWHVYNGIGMGTHKNGASQVSSKATYRIPSQKGD